MGSDGIVQPPPLLDEYGGLGQCVEDLTVQELLPQLTVEALVVAVLPRTARLDVERLDTDAGQPPSHELRRELRTVVRAKMLRRTVPREELSQDLEHVMGSKLSSDLDRHTLPRVLVEHRQQLQSSTIVRPCAHEVVGPDMITVQRPEPDARAMVEPQPALLRLSP